MSKIVKNTKFLYPANSPKTLHLQSYILIFKRLEIELITKVVGD